MRTKIFKNLYIIFVFIFFVICISNVSVIYADDSNPVYLSATEYDYPPFSVTDDGKADGFSVDLLKAVAEEMGIVVTFKIDQWTVLKEELKNGELDILPLVGYTVERDEFYDFTVPYIVMRGNIFVRTGDDSIQSEEDLFGKQILVLDGDNSQEWAVSIGLDDELTATATYLEAFELLADGQYDAVLAQALVGEKLIADHELNNIEAVYVYDDEGITRIKLNLDGYEQKFCFAVTEGNAELLSILNEGLSIVSQNGTYDELYQKWFPFLIEEGQVSIIDILTYVTFILVPILIVLLILYNITVRKTIKLKTEQIEKNNKRNEIIVNAFQRNFESDEKRFVFIIEELVMNTDSEFGFMFSIDIDQKIIIRSCFSTSTDIEHNHENLISIIKEKLLNEELLSESDTMTTNNYYKNYVDGDLEICGNTIYRTLIVSVKGLEKRHVAALFNKSADYTIDNVNQTSILLTGIWSILERSDQINRIEHLSFHDSLTGLYNRRYFEEELKRLDNSKNYPLSLVMGDVDGLKSTNDSYGHLAGDELLKTVGKVLLNNVDNNDIVARWGGDEFVMIFPNTSEEDTCKIIHKISDEISKEKFSIGKVSIALGYNVKTDEKEHGSKMFLAAEEMMYKIKNQ